MNWPKGAQWLGVFVHLVALAAAAATVLVNTRTKVLFDEHGRTDKCGKNSFCKIIKIISIFNSAIPTFHILSMTRDKHQEPAATVAINS